MNSPAASLRSSGFTGGDTLKRSLRVLREGGIAVGIGGPPDPAYASGSQLTAIAALVDAGHIHPVIDRVYPFDETLDALAQVATGHVKGKVVVSLR